MAEGKVCNKCGLFKAYSEFGKNCRRPDGYQDTCKDCTNAYKRAYREANAEHDQAMNKAYREANRERISEYLSAYHAAHKGDPETIAKQQAYREAHREEARARSAAYHEQHKNDEEYKRRIRENSQRYYREKRGQEVRAKYTAEHKEEKAAYDRTYYQENKEQRTAYQAEYKANNPDKIKAQAEAYKDRKNALRREDPKRNLDDRFIFCLNNLIRAHKVSSLFQQLDYTPKRFLKHIKSQFTPEMTWDNYGEYWEIDHVIPRKEFDYTSSDDKQFKLCWSLINLRPLPVSENRKRPRDGSDISEEVRQAILNQEI